MKILQLQSLLMSHTTNEHTTHTHNKLASRPLLFLLLLTLPSLPFSLTMPANYASRRRRSFHTHTCALFVLHFYLGYCIPPALLTDCNIFNNIIFIPKLNAYYE